jgi:hypothetical protein
VTLRPIGNGDIYLLYPGWPTISPCLPFTERLSFRFEAMNMQPSRKMKLIIAHDFFNPGDLSFHEYPFGDQFPGPAPIFSLPVGWPASISPFEHCSHNCPGFLDNISGGNFITLAFWPSGRSPISRHTDGAFVH